MDINYQRWIDLAVMQAMKEIELRKKQETQKKYESIMGMESSPEKPKEEIKSVIE